VSLGHVLWVGGGQGAGKTTVARTIAHRHGLRVYHVDARTWAHAERAEGVGFPAMAAFAAKTLEERWVDQEPQAMVEEFLAYSRDRFRMIVQDLCALPSSPGIVAEGPQLLPDLVAPLLARPDAAIWLIPTRRLQAELHDARPSSIPEVTSDPERTRRNMLDRNVLIAAALRDDANAHGFPVLEVARHRRLVTTSRPGWVHSRTCLACRTFARSAGTRTSSSPTRSAASTRRPRRLPERLRRRTRSRASAVASGAWRSSICRIRSSPSSSPPEASSRPIEPFHRGRSDQ
jgi:hypothetical protein